MSIQTRVDAVCKLYGFKTICDLTKQELRAVIGFLDSESLLTPEFIENEEYAVHALDLIHLDVDQTLQKTVVDNFVAKYEFNELYTAVQMSRLMECALHDVGNSSKRHLQYINWMLLGSDKELSCCTLVSDVVSCIRNIPVHKKLFVGL